MTVNSRRDLIPPELFDDQNYKPHFPRNSPAEKEHLEIKGKLNKREH